MAAPDSLIRAFHPPNYLYWSENKIFSMKRLYRSKNDRILGGVCAGLGQHLDLDPNVIRLIWAAVTVLSFGVGVIVYILAWILIPEPGSENGIFPSAQPGEPG